MDAVTVKDGDIRHLCGHDGHASSLCAFALTLQNLALNRDVILVFQAAEEDGSGARKACPFLARNQVERIYGYHNIPQGEEGVIWLRNATLACASRGLSLHLQGSVSHAAYPELGKNPSYLLGKILHFIEEINKEVQEGISFITPVGIHGGNSSYGVSCGDVSLYLTLRSEKENILCTNEERLLTYVEKLSREEGIRFRYAEVDIFPEIHNEDTAFNDLKEAVHTVKLPYLLLKEPMRWSEDFGCYSQVIPETTYFGIGSGTKHGLHTDKYFFNDNILEIPVKIYTALCLKLGKESSND